MILTTTYESNPKAIVWNGSKKLMSVKTRTIKEVSVVQFYMVFVDTTQNNEKLVCSIW